MMAREGTGLRTKLCPTPFYSEEETKGGRAMFGFLLSINRVRQEGFVVERKRARPRTKSCLTPFVPHVLPGIDFFVEDGRAELQVDVRRL